jgi:pimeloyl-ACP methyl ester carboxylesterase
MPAYFVVLMMVAFLAALPAAPVAADSTEPLVIVVHGIGGGSRDDGWSQDVAKRWSVQTHEVTFRQEGRTWGTSFVDFANKAGDWARDTQNQIKAIVQKNPGRRVIIVAHSWGTVVTKLALGGGMASGLTIKPIDLGVDIDELVTIGSPLGRAETPEVAGNLRQLNVIFDVDGRPSMVKHWSNFFDPNDPVSNQSHRLAGADNIQVDGSGAWWDVTGMTYHTGIWQNRRVNSHVWDTFLRVSNLPPLLPKPGPGGLTPIGKPSSEASVIAEYRSLLPRFLQANKKPWHTRVELVHNATPVANGYRVNWVTWCLIEKGPDTGKDYHCFENDSTFNFGQISQAVRDMKASLGVK